MFAGGFGNLSAMSIVFRSLAVELSFWNIPNLCSVLAYNKCFLHSSKLNKSTELTNCTSIVLLKSGLLTWIILAASNSVKRKSSRSLRFSRVCSLSLTWPSMRLLYAQPEYKKSQLLKSMSHSCSLFAHCQLGDFIQAHSPCDRCVNEMTGDSKTNNKIMDSDKYRYVTFSWSISLFTTFTLTLTLLTSLIYIIWSMDAHEMNITRRC